MLQVTRYVARAAITLYQEPGPMEAIGSALSVQRFSNISHRSRFRLAPGAAHHLDPSGVRARALRLIAPLRHDAIEPAVPCGKRELEPKPVRCFALAV